ncbi:hypothetical protein K474DRAFT_1005478 [Panus rudis PR-1116 ss-1]|nr:hypothetical protein K474DRAFT_1005478 [Panus rudis PR-1116 ss-1]
MEVERSGLAEIWTKTRNTKKKHVSPYAAFCACVWHSEDVNSVLSPRTLSCQVRLRRISHGSNLKQRRQGTNNARKGNSNENNGDTPSNAWFPGPAMRLSNDYDELVSASKQSSVTGPTIRGGVHQQRRHCSKASVLRLCDSQPRSLPMPLLSLFRLRNSVSSLEM